MTTFGSLSASWEVQKVTLMGMGTISDPGISVLNKTNVREQGENTKLLGNGGTNNQVFLGLLHVSNPTW